jgi:co-chaperonin GroES (HSP10)
MTSIKPLGKLLLVKEIETTESKSAGGLIIAATATVNDLKKGTVVKVGDGERSNFNGEVYPVDVIKEGMIVYYSPNHATEVVDNETSEKFYFVNSGVLFGYEELNA